MNFLSIASVMALSMVIYNVDKKEISVNYEKIQDENEKNEYAERNAIQQHKLNYKIDSFSILDRISQESNKEDIAILRAIDIYTKDNNLNLNNYDGEGNPIGKVNLCKKIFNLNDDLNNCYNVMNNNYSFLLKKFDGTAQYTFVDDDMEEIRKTVSLENIGTKNIEKINLDNENTELSLEFKTINKDNTEEMDESLLADMFNDNENINNPIVSNPNPIVSNPNPIVSNPNPIVSNPNPISSNPNPISSNPISIDNYVIESYEDFDKSYKDFDFNSGSTERNVIDVQDIINDMRRMRE